MHCQDVSPGMVALHDACLSDWFDMWLPYFMHWPTTLMNWPTYCLGRQLLSTNLVLSMTPGCR